jgi:DNA repair protein RadA/Sms
MAKPALRHVCQACGEVYAKWQGHCGSCGAWNSLVEEAGAVVTPFSARHSLAQGGSRVSLVALNTQVSPPARQATGIDELDRVLGGGLVPGSAILVGGDPGIGKSTLLLQAAALLAERLGPESGPVIYLSGEEATEQVQLRAQRLGLDQAPVQLAAATSVRDILATLKDQRPTAMIIDSIQTMYSDTLESAPGTVAQVRASAQELIGFAKRSGAALFLVGHVTKDGQIAGPRVLEHMVDAVLYFEGERGHPYRILRGVKNRFGATDEIGVFEMGDSGLREVANPSALFLSSRSQPAAGSVVFAGLEGSRPLLVEIQALVARVASGATPRRAVVGWDSGRLAMVLAVLESRCGLPFGAHEVYLNVAGGLRVSEPAADLAVAAALISALTDTPLPARSIVFGEISLSGDVRAVSQPQARLKEGAKLGFERALTPVIAGSESSLETSEFSTLRRLVDFIAPR